MIFWGHKAVGFLDIWSIEFINELYFNQRNCGNLGLLIWTILEPNINNFSNNSVV